MIQGIHKDITIQDYHLDKRWISATGLKHAKKSMAEYRLFLDGYYDNEVKAHFDFGNAVELFLLDKNEYEKSVAVAEVSKWITAALSEKPDLKVPKSSKAYKDLEGKFLEKHGGKYIIPDSGDNSLETIQMIVARCKADPWISMLLDKIEYQNTLCWVDPETGLQMKTRPDICQITKNVVINLKSTVDASPEHFSRELAKYDYPLQACVEIAGVEATGLMSKVEKYFWLVFEKTAPFNVQLYEFHMGDAVTIMDHYHFLLRRIKRCIDLDVWPGYSDRASNEFGILTAKIPGYYNVYENYDSE